MKFARRSRDENLLVTVATLLDSAKASYGKKDNIAAEYYAMAGCWKEAAQAIRSNWSRKAFKKRIEYYQEGGFFEESREELRRWARWELSWKKSERRAIMLLRSDGMSKKEAYLYLASIEGLFRKKLWLRAAFYEKAEAWDLAAETWKSCNNQKKAQKCLEKKERGSREKMSLAQKADRAFEAVEFAKALRLYKKAKMLRRVADTLNTMGRGVEAQRAYQEAEAQEEEQRRERKLLEEIEDVSRDL